MYIFSINVEVLFKNILLSRSKTPLKVIKGFLKENSSITKSSAQYIFI